MKLSKVSDDDLQGELKRRLRSYDELFAFVKELAEWNATTDSFYDTFDGYRKQAGKIIKNVAKCC